MGLFALGVVALAAQLARADPRADRLAGVKLAVGEKSQQGNQSVTGAHAVTL